jgi:hypothetical protein
MEIFDVKRKDVHNFDDFMDLKKPAFGGPSSGMLLKDGKGKYVNKDRKLKEYQRTVDRHDSNNLFNNQVYDPTYKAMGGDRSTHVDGTNPYDYKDPYETMGIPVVVKNDKTNEHKCNTSFAGFVLESDHQVRDYVPSQLESDDDDCKCDDDCECKKCSSKN